MSLAPTMTGYMSTAQIASRLGISPRSVSTYCQQGRLYCELQPGTRGYQVPVQDAHRFIEDYIQKRGAPLVVLADRKYHLRRNTAPKAQQALYITLRPEVLQRIDEVRRSRFKRNGRRMSRTEMVSEACEEWFQRQAKNL